MNELPEKIEWTISVPILRNSVILKQLGFAIGIPFGILFLFMIYFKAYYGLMLVAALFLLSYVFIRIVWGGKYEVGFVLSKAGIRCYTLEKQARTNRIINTITVLGGFLSGKFAAAGAGILAQSRQDVLVKWKNIKKVKYLPKKNTVMIKGGFAENIAVFCTKENYTDAVSFIQQWNQIKQMKV